MYRIYQFAKSRRIMEIITVKIQFEDESEYPVRVYNVVGEVEIGVTHCKGNRDTPAATKHKMMSASITVTSFNEDGFEEEVEVDDDWKQKAYEYALSQL